MVYTFELIKHANIRYRDAFSTLARFELFVMLFSLGISTGIREETLGGSCFLVFESRPLSPDELAYLSGHSSIVFMAEKTGDHLLPLPVSFSSYLGEDLPEVLKYKGKTSVPFTRMMINVAAALSSFRGQAGPLTFFDPVCGKGTGCFCAVCAGMNAYGLDISHKEIREAADYFSRYLKYHKLKHEIKNRSETSSGHPVPITVFTFSDTREHYQQKDFRTLSLSCADAMESPALFRRSKAHIIAADLPYGIQHAPQSGMRPESISRFLHRVLPSWKQCLAPGGVIALSFNTLTLPADEVRNALISSGFRLPANEMFYQLRHEVEQAVVRDVVFAFNTEEDPVL